MLSNDQTVFEHKNHHEIYIRLSEMQYVAAKGAQLYFCKTKRANKVPWVSTCPMK